MPGVWNDGTERKLLLNIIHLTGPKPDWGKVATMMGEGYTAESTRQHYAKMKKDCAKVFGEPEIVADDKGAKGTPKKNKAAKENGETPTKSGRKRKGKKDEDEDDAELESPTKKKKKGCKAEEDAEESS